MDTMHLPAFVAPVQRSIRLRYITLMWEKCVANIPVMHAIAMKMHVMLSLLTVVVVHICLLTGVQVKYVNGQPIKASGVDDVGYLTDV